MDLQLQKWTTAPIENVQQGIKITLTEDLQQGIESLTPIKLLHRLKIFKKGSNPPHSPTPHELLRWLKTLTDSTLKSQNHFATSI